MLYLKYNLRLTGCVVQTVTLLFVTGLYELQERVLPVVFRGMKAHLTEQKTHLCLKVQTWVASALRNDLNDSLLW